MADVNEPKKETVRITLPPPPAANPSAADGGYRDTVRINLPPRPPSSDLPARPAGEVLKPPASAPPIARPPDLPGPGEPPKAPPSTSASAAATSLTASPSSTSSPGPKKETARIAIPPERSSMSPTVKMSKTQPLIAAPLASAEGAPVFVAPNGSSAPIDSIPILLCWTMLGVSAVIFIIQLWAYLS